MSEPSWEELQRLWTSLPPEAAPVAKELRHMRTMRVWMLVGAAVEVLTALAGFAAGIWFIARGGAFFALMGAATIAFTAVVSALSIWARMQPPSAPRRRRRPGGGRCRAQRAHGCSAGGGDDLQHLRRNGLHGDPRARTRLARARRRECGRLHRDRYRRAVADAVAAVRVPLLPEAQRGPRAARINRRFARGRLTRKSPHSCRIRSSARVHARIRVRHACAGTAEAYSSEPCTASRRTSHAVTASRWRTTTGWPRSASSGRMTASS